MTRTLAAGNYTLVTSFCCTGYSFVFSNGGATSALTDGFNDGLFAVGGTSQLGPTLAAIAAYAVDSEHHAAEAYSFTISTESNVLNTTAPTQPVPEPGTWMLLGSGLVALVARARRRG